MARKNPNQKILDLLEKWSNEDYGKDTRDFLFDPSPTFFPGTYIMSYMVSHVRSMIESGNKGGYTIASLVQESARSHWAGSGIRDIFIDLEWWNPETRNSMRELGQKILREDGPESRKAIGLHLHQMMWAQLLTLFADWCSAQGFNIYEQSVIGEVGGSTDSPSSSDDVSAADEVARLYGDV